MDLIDRTYIWKNQPAIAALDENRISITTEPNSDFWQRTHYGFRRDSGHCLLTQVSGDFTMTVEVEFDYKDQFDQCGVMVYQNEDTWMKGSIEKENDQIGRIGSVVTNLGYSDWATSDIPASVRAVAYRLHRHGEDFLLERSLAGEPWVQMRIFHMHHIETQIAVGVYACSPKDSSFTARFSVPVFSNCSWTGED